MAFTTNAWGLAGTMKVAQKGQKAYVSSSQLEGVEAFLNDPSRGDGFNDFFSEWPNDVNQYQYHIESMSQLNELLVKFSEIKSEQLRVILSPMKEPSGFGWVSKFEKGNATPVIFTLGDQERIDQWYAQLNGRKFGVMEFTACPQAIPPTLTIFVGHEVIRLDELIVSDRVSVTLGYVPTGFHVSNLKPVEKSGSKPAGLVEPVTDPVLREATRQINEFLENRKTAKAD